VPYLESLVVAGIQTSVWTKVNLTRSYVSPVVVCSIKYDNGTALTPAIVRMRNVNGASFEMRMQNPSDVEIADWREVSCVVVEEGAWKMPDGHKIEAVQYTSTLTDRKLSFNGQPRSYLHGNYTSPVVLGQVMSYNDPKWSVFWSRGTNRTSPPDSTSFFAGKHIGKDNRLVRANETIGYIVMDAGHATFSGIEMEAKRGGKLALDYISTSRKYTFVKSFLVEPKVTILCQAGTLGTDGSWAVLKVSPSRTTMSVAVDEDQTTVVERSHASAEILDYAVFAKAGSIQLLRS
jgi:hypothetical protein